MERIYKILKKEINKNSDKQLVIWCIGTKKVIGDSLGPYVGEKLIRNNKNNNIVIKGSLSNQINYLNIEQEIKKLNKKYSYIYSVVVDSCLYTKNSIGELIISKNNVILGSALKKSNYIIGDISIKGIVGEDYKSPLENIKSLEKVPKDIIKEMSFKISNQILKSIN